MEPRQHFKRFCAVGTVIRQTEAQPPGLMRALVTILGTLPKASTCSYGGALLERGAAILRAFFDPWLQHATMQLFT